MDNKELLGDVVASIVEKTLMNLGINRYTQVRDILADSNLSFSDCYQNPDALKFALGQVFANRHLAVVEEIRSEIGGLADDDESLAGFLQKLSA
ncbi:MAG: hypothetical protein KGI25_09700 [Thaumarchaeota archaeon]|nr:hypothetical protein [Nitrososphaerota archaeon]